MLLGCATITVNKNAVPNDPRSPFVTSGIRIGTPAVTTRGFGTVEVSEIAGWMGEVMGDVGNGSVIMSTRERAKALCRAYPGYRQ